MELLTDYYAEFKREKVLCFLKKMKWISEAQDKYSLKILNPT